MPTPEWSAEDGEDCFVYVKRLSPKERDAWEVEMAIPDGEEESPEAQKRQNLDFTAKLCVAVICDESGKPLFGLDEIQELSEGADSVALRRCYHAATRLNGMNKKELEDLEKNSGSARADSSPIDSQPN